MHINKPYLEYSYFSSLIEREDKEPLIPEKAAPWLAAGTLAVPGIQSYKALTDYTGQVSEKKALDAAHGLGTDLIDNIDKNRFGKLVPRFIKSPLKAKAKKDLTRVYSKLTPRYNNIPQLKSRAIRKGLLTVGAGLGIYGLTRLNRQNTPEPEGRPEINTSKPLLIGAGSSLAAIGLLGESIKQPIEKIPSAGLNLGRQKLMKNPTLLKRIGVAATIPSKKAYRAIGMGGVGLTALGLGFPLVKYNQRGNKVIQNEQ